LRRYTLDTSLRQLSHEVAQQRAAARDAAGRDKEATDVAHEQRLQLKQLSERHDFYTIHPPSP